MVYRDGAHPNGRQPISIRLGPLSKPWAALGIAFLFLVGSALMLGFGASRDHVRCSRHDGRGSCVVDTESAVFSYRRAQFELGEVREIRWVPYEGNKGADKGKTELITTSGRSIYIADGQRSDAHRVYQALNGFLESSTQTSLDINQPRPMGAFVFGFILLIGALGLVVSFFRTTTSIRLIVDREADLLTTKRRHFGVPGRGKNLELCGLNGVDVEEGRVNVWYQQKNSQGKPGFRLIAQYVDGTTAPLDDAFHLGRAVHYRAAQRLREVLALETEDEKKPGYGFFNSDVDAVQPPITNQPPPSTAFPKGMLKMIAPIIGLMLAVPVVIFVMEVSDPNAGTLEVRCQHRCKFGSMECLPGGHWRQSIKAGQYTFEVWNPDVAGNWERRVVEVKAGGHTNFTCQPTQTSE